MNLPSTALAFTVLIAAGPVFAANSKAPIVITMERIRLPPPGAPTAAGYATITNTSDKPDRLLGGSTPAAVRLELHEMSMNGGVMRMRAVTGGLPIGARQTVELSEGGYHFMLIAPRRPLKEGDRVPAFLRFQNIGGVPVMFKVGS